MDLGGKDEKEETFVISLLEDMPKNYQIWNFRRQMFMSGYTSVEAELGYADRALQQDGKNYHAWAHRQAVLNAASIQGDAQCWTEELTYVERMLEDDVFNNSAWTQRSWVVQKLTPDTKLADVDKTLTILKQAPHCTAGWNYLLSLLSEAAFRLKDLISFCHKILKDQPHCLPCLEFLADVYFFIGMRNDHHRHACLTSAIKIWRSCSKIDPIRMPYWCSRQHHVHTLLSV